MKNQIKRSLFTVFAILISSLIFGQSNNKFYASLENFINEKPIDGYEIIEGSYGMTLGLKSFKIKTGSETKRTKLSNLPSELYTYQGNLMRTYKGTCYLVLVAGPICYYAEHHNNGYQLYSETMSGNLNKFSQKIIEKYLKQYNLLESYEKEKPKREFKDSSNDYFNKVVARNIKYFHLINERAK